MTYTKNDDLHLDIKNKCKDYADAAMDNIDTLKGSVLGLLKGDTRDQLFKPLGADESYTKTIPAWASPTCCG